MDPTISFILQVALAVLMLFFGIILNGIRLGMDQIRQDLKLLNDAVLGKYATIEAVDRWRERHLREESEKWESHTLEASRASIEQRRLDHELRNELQIIKVTLATMQAKTSMDSK